MTPIFNDIPGLATPFAADVDAGGHTLLNVGDIEGTAPGLDLSGNTSHAAWLRCGLADSATYGANDFLAFFNGMPGSENSYSVNSSGGNKDFLWSDGDVSNCTVGGNGSLAGLFSGSGYANNALSAENTPSDVAAFFNYQYTINSGGSAAFLFSNGNGGDLTGMSYHQLEGSTPPPVSTFSNDAGYLVNSDSNDGDQLYIPSQSAQLGYLCDYLIINYDALSSYFVDGVANNAEYATYAGISGNLYYPDNNVLTNVSNQLLTPAGSVLSDSGSVYDGYGNEIYTSYAMVGSNLSGFNNDAGFVTNAAQVGDSISEFYNDAGYVNAAGVSLLDLSSNSGSFGGTSPLNCYQFFPNGPGGLSQFLNDDGYLQSEADPVFEAWLATPPGVSAFTNDAGYATQASLGFNVKTATPHGGYYDSGGGYVSTQSAQFYYGTGGAGGNIDTSGASGSPSYDGDGAHGGSIYTCADDYGNNGGDINTSAGGAGLITSGFSPVAGWLMTFDGTNMVPSDPAANLLLPVAGSFSGTGAATASFTVTIGHTMPGTTYKVNATPASTVAAAVFYISAKTTTTFTVTYLTGLTGAVAFDWAVFP